MSSASDVRGQWINPGNILDILLLVGGDVVRTALAQLAGTCAPTPVVFSFGWVAYAFTGLVAVVGDKRLLPEPDVSSIVINASTGYVRDNHSWILGRLLRDFEEGYWMPREIKQSLADMLKEPLATLNLSRTQKKGLCISIFEADSKRPAKCTVLGPLFYVGYIVTVLQLVIAALPWIIWKGSNYMTFIITAAGTLLAYSTASLPQWRRERFDCRENSTSAFVLTRGNGAQHALVILGEGRGLNLEDLATSGDGQNRASKGTQALFFWYTVLWVALLITVDGLRSYTWFLVAVGGIGSIYTSLVAALPRKPEQFGVPLCWTGKCIANDKVMCALIEAELYRPGLGRSMLETFFPGSRSTKEDEFWETAKEVELIQTQAVGHPKVDAMAAQGVTTLSAKLPAPPPVPPPVSPPVPPLAHPQTP